MTDPRKPLTLGVIVGNRGFFPGHLCEVGRATVLKVLAEEGVNAIALTPEDTEYGSVESVSDARKCAELFRAHRDEIDGVLITLPNFGDERAIANTLRWAELDVPVLVQAFPDEVGKMGLTNRRDSFCGKMSACNNLKQYGIKYSLTSLHTVDPESESFRADLQKFVKVCRIVGGLKGARFGQLGRDRQHSTPCATAKSCWSGPAFRWKRSTSPTHMAASNSCLTMTKRCRQSWRKSKPTSPETMSPTCR